MRVQKGNSYSINDSDVIVSILSIPYENDQYQKVKTVIYHKSTLDVLEGPSYYKLNSERIKHWKLWKQ